MLRKPLGTVAKQGIRKRLQKTIASIAVGSLMAGALVSSGTLGSAIAHAAEPAVLEITKSVKVGGKTYDDPEVAPTVTVDEQFIWVIDIVCHQQGSECIDATLTDVIPDEFEILEDSINSTPSGTISVTGQTVTIAFQQELENPAGSVGLISGASVSIPVKLREIDHSRDKEVLTNTASVVAENAPKVLDEESVRASVPLILKAQASKSFDPESALAEPGASVGLTFGGTNASNARVDTLIVQDPANPADSPNIFQQHLQVESLTAATWPTGAERAVVSVWDVSAAGGGAWVDADSVTAPETLALPTGVDPAHIGGVRIAFSSTNPTIDANASTSVQLALSQRDSVSAISANAVLPNTSSALVSVGAEESAPASQDAAVTLRPASSAVRATKNIAPYEIAVVGPTTESTVTLGAQNNGSRELDSLTITEPTNPADLSAGNLLAPAFDGGGVTFRGFGEVVWPAGAEEASIRYHYSDGTSSEVLSTKTVNTLPAADADRRVTGFAVTFTGTIAEGAEATVPFTVKAPESLNSGQRIASGDNTIEVTGTTPGSTPDPAPDTATDDLKIYAEQITISTEKSLSHETLWAIPGQTTTAQLMTTIAEYPKTTENVHRVVIDDPSWDGVPDGSWYDHFNATAITLTQVPTNATLTVQWRNEAGDYQDVPGMVGLAGGIHSKSLTDGTGLNLDDITGIRFIYESDEGFVPGQSLAANVTYATRSHYRNAPTELIPRNHSDENNPAPLFILDNDVASQAWSDDLESERVTDDDVVQLMPAGSGPGPGPGIEKVWSPDQVITRSGQSTTVALNWTAGVQGIDTVVIGDVALSGDTVTQLGNKSVFDSFNLTAIGPINDPLFAFDQVHIQVFNGTEWVDLGSCTESDPCSGSAIGKISLTNAQQATTQAVRFVVTEKADRAPVTIADPLPGTGVAVGQGTRQIPLTLQIRDTLRTDAQVPVLAGPLYNTTTASQVENSASVEGYVDGGRTHRDTSSDTIMLVDPVLGQKTEKSVEGSPMAIPSDWSTDQAPTVRYTIATTNTTAGIDGLGGRVSELRIDEPGHTDAAETESPFDVLTLQRFHSVTAPTGTTHIRIEFTGTNGETVPLAIETNPLAPQTPGAQALAALQLLTPAELQHVTSFSVVYTGNIAAGDTHGVGAVSFDAQLRQYLRSDPSTAVTLVDSPLGNTVKGTISDLRWDKDHSAFVTETLAASDDADVLLQAGSISVEAGKSFSPSSQTEPDTSQITMTLAGKPGGTQRTKVLELTDDRATFWNAYDLKRVANSFTLPTFAPANPAMQVAFSICTNRDFDAWATGVADDADLASAGCAATGGSWSPFTDPMTATDARSWNLYDGTGVDPGTDIQGIKVRVSRVGDRQWENPANPTVSVPFKIERRAELRSGGDVPSTLIDGHAAAPGQASKGVSDNSVNALITGIWGGTAENDAHATITYRHAKNAVEVRKDPVGVRAPGSVFDYTISVRNTGDRDIVDPVITDKLPYKDGLGVMVEFDPDADESKPRYVFTTSGPSSSTHPMPTVLGGATGVTVQEQLEGAEPSLTFTFPEGTTLARGQSYTITFKMMFVPGVIEGEPVVNAFNISADRVWDECTAPAGRVATLNDVATECATTAQVTPQRLPALRAVKSVRALGNGEFNTYGFVDAAVCEGKVNSESFAYQPCLPRTAPGQEKEWQLSVVNNGTTPLNRVVIADVLPTPNDTTLMAGFARNSQWTTLLTDRQPTLNDPNLSFESYVTTAPRTEPCLTSAVRTPHDAGLAACIDETGGDDEAQTKFIPFENLSDHSAATALLFVINTKDAAVIEPGARLNVRFVTETGPFSVQDATDPGAFNSLTVSALYAESAGSTTQSVLSARDQSRAGVALITGSIQIEKTVSGAASSFVPDGQVFTGKLVCTSVGQPIPDRDFTVVAGTPTVIEHLPANARCTAKETAESGQTSYTASTVTVPVGATGELPTLMIDNVYELTDLEVSKSVSTDAALIPTGFEFTVECTFLGEVIELAPEDAKFTLNHNQKHTITGLPVNSTCTVAETNDRQADSVTVEAESLDAAGDAWGTVTENSETAEATIAGLAPVTGANTVAFTNTYGESAALRVVKQLAGGAADLAADFTFEVQVVCTFEEEVLLNETVSLHKGNGFGNTLSSLVAGAECVITEDDLRGADAVVITPNDSTDTSIGIVTIPAGATEPVNIEVTNRYLAGSIQVTKAVTGEGAELYGGGDFTVTMECTLNGEPVRIVGGAERTLNATDNVVSYTGLPSGAECVLTETDTGGATESRIALGTNGEWFSATDAGVSFTVAVDSTADSNADQAQPAAQVENRFDLAEVSVTKIVVSDATSSDGTPVAYGPFTVQLSCTFEGEPIEIPGGAEQILEDGDVITWVDLPAGALCEVEETSAADASAVWFEQAADDPLDEPIVTDGEVLQLAALEAVGGERENGATLFNAFDVTTLTILKSLDGPGADLGKDQRFEVALQCVLTDATRPEGEVVWDDAYTLSSANGWRVDVDNIAAGAKCAIVETERGDAYATEISIDGTVIGSHKATFVLDEAQLTLTVKNSFEALPNTGTNAVAVSAIVGALLMMLVGATVYLAGRRQRGAHAAR